MILLIDNYDSFTFNLVHLLGEVGATFARVRAQRRPDRATQALALNARSYRALALAPARRTEAGICLDAHSRSGRARSPCWGVCLGHQAIGQTFGGTVQRAPAPMHGKVGRVEHAGSDIFAGLPSPFEAARYHSLIVDRATLPPVLEATAWTGDGLVMGLASPCTLPLFGVQFHPESIASAARPRDIARQLPRHRPWRKRALRARATRPDAGWTGANLKPVPSPGWRAGETLSEAEAENGIRHHHVRRGHPRRRSPACS